MSTTDKLINILLYINKANVQKSFVELITLNPMRFKPEEEHLRKIFLHVTEQNYLFTNEMNVSATPNKISFAIKSGKKLLKYWDIVADYDPFAEEIKKEENLIDKSLRTEKSLIKQGELIKENKNIYKNSNLNLSRNSKNEENNLNKTNTNEEDFNNENLKSPNNNNFDNFSNNENSRIKTIENKENSQSYNDNEDIKDIDMEMMVKDEDNKEKAVENEVEAMEADGAEVKVMQMENNEEKGIK